MPDPSYVDVERRRLMAALEGSAVSADELLAAAMAGAAQRHSTLGGVVAPRDERTDTIGWLDLLGLVPLPGARVVAGAGKAAQVARAGAKGLSAKRKFNAAAKDYNKIMEHLVKYPDDMVHHSQMVKAMRNFEDGVASLRGGVSPREFLRRQPKAVRGDDFLEMQHARALQHLETGNAPGMMAPVSRAPRNFQNLLGDLGRMPDKSRYFDFVENYTMAKPPPKRWIRQAEKDVAAWKRGGEQWPAYDGPLI